MKSIEKARKAMHRDACTNANLAEAFGARGSALIAETLEVVFNAIESELAERYMELPVDADGVPIRVGDKMEYADGTEFEVDGIGSGGTLFSVDNASNSAWWTNAEAKRHVIPRTVEDVLRDLVDGIGSVDFDALTAIDGAAAEIRELMGVDDD